MAYTYDNKYLISTGHDSLILSFITGMGNPDPNEEPRVVKEPPELYNNGNNKQNVQQWLLD